ncbi:MAG: rRNA maturation RNase YbeY [Planctomycetes bacterium]|nr:rRNA maturation RNase YbeY [Planctomycetota bacterium]MCH8119200.1 rRNA maturation RNase YbeY [Planctomycetota bacterium]
MAPAKQDQEIVVQITKNFSSIDACLSRVKKLVETVCNRFNPCGSRGTVVSIAIVDDARIRKLNSRFLNRKSTTDCLSFDLSDSKGPKSPKLFELIVNGEMAVRQANMRGHSSEAELALYITHGLLHNFGFDDSTESQARKMHDTEDKILQQLGYGLVYNTNSR